MLSRASTCSRFWALALAGTAVALFHGGCEGEIRGHSAVSELNPNGADRGSRQPKDPQREPGASDDGDPAAPGSGPAGNGAPEPEPDPRVCPDLGTVGAPVPLRRL